jgi:pilus assembly protein CpaB
VNVYVAAKPIPIGTTITEDMVAVQPWPEHLVLDGFVKAEGGPSKVVGTVARAAFQQQEPIISAKLANPNDPNFLAGELPKGMRVITIPINETEGIGGFVFPGDRVDVILTHEIDKPKFTLGSDAPSVEKDSVTETLLTNTMVVAVDQRAAGAQATDDKGNLIIPHSVSLMVSPADAQRIRLGEKVGTLTLTLRSMSDKDVTDPLTLTTGNDITQYKMGMPVIGGETDIVVHRGAPEGSGSAEGAKKQPFFFMPPSVGSGVK